MNTFKQFFNYNSVLLEFFNSIDGAVSHIDHLEENILNYGEKGVVDIEAEFLADFSDNFQM